MDIELNYPFLRTVASACVLTVNDVPVITRLAISYQGEIPSLTPAIAMTLTGRGSELAPSVPLIYLVAKYLQTFL